MNERVDYVCGGCGQRLSAPESWSGRRAACPVCGATASVPQGELSSPDTPEGELSSSDTPEGEFSFAPTQEPADNIVFASPPRRTSSAAAAVPPAGPGFFRRYRVYLIAGLVVLLLVGWWWSWRWYYRNYVRADAIMRNRGYGVQLEKPPDPARQQADRHLAGIGRALRAYDANPASLDIAISLSRDLDAALRDIDRFNPDEAAWIMNNAAWVMSTSPHLGLRDAPRALELARAAVDISGRGKSAILDTLAEALFINGFPDEALAVSREALALSPDDPYLQKRPGEFESRVGNQSGDKD